MEGNWRSSEREENNDRLDTCVDETEESYILQILDELKEEEPDLSREAAKEIIPWDLDKVKEIFKEKVSFTSCKNHPKASESLRIAKRAMPEIAEKIEDCCFVLKDGHYTEDCGMHVTINTDRVSKDAIFLNEASVKYMSPEAVARVILHEGLHKDVIEEPEKYGFDEKMLSVFPLFSDHVHNKISKELEKVGLETFKSEAHDAIDKSYKDMREGRLKRFVAQTPIYIIKACMDGCEFHDPYKRELA